MTVPHPFIAWMNEYIAVRKYLSTDADGRKIYADPNPYRCFIDRKAKVIGRNTQGDTVTASATVYLKDYSPEITTQDELTLPDASKPAILRVTHYQDDRAPTYSELSIE